MYVVVYKHVTQLYVFGHNRADIIIYYAWRVCVSLPGVISYVNKVYGMFNHLRSCVSTSSI